MHKLQMYEDLRDMLEREVKDIERRGEMSEQSLDNLYKLMTAIKVVDKCIDREKGGQGQGQQEEMMRGMSMGGGMSNARGRSNESYGMMPYPYMSYEGSNEGRSYDGMSNESGQSNARRGRDGDSDGRYNESRESRDSFRNSQDRGNSYENSYEYSRDASKKKMIQKLETLMDDTMSEHERKAIMECIEKIK